MDRWCQQNALPPGATLTLAQAWELGRIWYSDRLDPAWKRKTKTETQAIFASLGLTSNFWSL